MSERETKHTPGPWHLDSLQVGGPDRLRVADVWTSDRPITEQRANARLVASAPELLEALRALMDDYAETMWLNRGIERDAMSDDGGAWDQAVAAIARATGGSDADDC